MIINNKLRCLALGAGMACMSAAAHATPFMNTLAWSRYITCTQAKLLPDGAGNTYLIYSKPDPSTGTDVSYIKYDASGNVMASHFLFFRASTSIDIDGAWLSPAGAATPGIYVSCDEHLTTTFGTVVTKSDLAGNQIWQGNYNGVATFEPVGGFVDASDNFWLAMSKQQSGTAVLDMVEIDPMGTVLSDQSNTNIVPGQAFFYKGKWVVLGRDANATNTESMRWGLYDPSNGNYLSGAAFDYIDNGTDNYGYFGLFGYVDPAGAIDIGTTVIETKDSDNSRVAEKYWFRRYNLTGSLQWISPSYDGYVGYLTSFGSNNSFYAGADGPGSLSVEQHDHLGNKVWNTPVTVPALGYMPVCDATGIYTIAVNLNNQKRIDLNRLDSAGNTVWTSSVATGAGSNLSSTTLLDATDSNNNLFTVIQVPVTNTTYQAVLNRYVPGVALSTLTAATATVLGGKIDSVKVQLNAPAPAGGILVKLTSSSAKALFPNSTTAYSMAIPAGSLYASVPVHTSAVTANTSVSILGNQSGVQRAVSFTITP
jgi:hypothetical protein